MSKTKENLRSPRSTFRHGDLRQALLKAAVELARSDGPRAVVLREATRQAGVAPNAAYRHFSSHRDLLQAVRSAALSSLALAIEQEIAQVKPSRSPAAVARATLRAVGTGYLKFALSETGLFRTAFSVPDSVDRDTDVAKTGTTGLNPFQLLSAALDKMMDSGVLPPSRRPGAEYLAWSAVHGMAILAIEGPLKSMPKSEIASLTQRLVMMVEKGL